MYDNLFVFFGFFNLLFDIFLKSISAACFLLQKYKLKVGLDCFLGHRCC